MGINRILAEFNGANINYGAAIAALYTDLAESGWSDVELDAYDCDKAFGLKCLIERSANRFAARFYGPECANHVIDAYMALLGCQAIPRACSAERAIVKRTIEDSFGR